MYLVFCYLSFCFSYNLPIQHLIVVNPCQKADSFSVNDFFFISFWSSWKGKIGCCLNYDVSSRH